MNGTPPRKTSRFANCGIFLSGRKIIPPPPSIAENTRHYSDLVVGLDAGANHGFGAGENDWLGAEAYIDSVR